MNVSLRSADASDEDFLRNLILETIAGELGASAWPEPMRSHLLGMQYTARRHSSRANFPDANDQIIEADGVDAGWVMVNTMPHEVRLVEIMVRPEMRGRGVGAAVIRGLLAGTFSETASGGPAGKPLRLHVNVTNHGAIRFYNSLGFRRIDGNEVQHVMEAYFTSTP